jgi:alpha-L-fucosidase 2
MLIQSHAGYVELLPALPKAWATGSVSGLMARGGFRVEMEWKEGVLTRVNILSKLRNRLFLRYGDQERIIETTAGQTLELDRTLHPI